MSTVDSKVMIFDNSCPMCKLYTFGFVKLKVLGPENRMSFEHASPELLRSLDLDRARHEIPLYDRESGTTLYGLDAMMHVLGNRWPILRPIFARALTKKILTPLYRFISYNRRVMAGCRVVSGFDCAPDFHQNWRITYLVFAILCVVAELVFLSIRGWSVLSVVSPLSLWFLLGLLGMNWVPGTERKWDYAGNLASIAMVFVMSTIPWAIAAPQSSLATTMCLAIGFGLVGWESNRRLPRFFGK